MILKNEGQLGTVLLNIFLLKFRKDNFIYLRR